MLHILLNPTTSGGASKITYSKIEKVLNEEGASYVLHVLKGAEDTINLTAELSREATEEKPVHLVVVGGDGTLNLVLQGIVNFENTYLSVIKTGSGNDFAHSMAVDGDPVKAVKHLLHSPSHMLIDYAVARFKPEECLPDAKYELDEKGWAKMRFMISCGFGYDADICEEANRSKLKKVLNKLKIGKLVYLLVGIKQIFTRENSQVEITTDSFSGKISHMFMAATMVQKYEGGGVPFCPHADCRDGKLSICIVRDMAKIKLLGAVAAVYAKKHLLFKGITEYKTESVSIKAKVPQWIHLDGEVGCKSRVIYMESRSGLNFVK